MAKLVMFAKSTWSISRPLAFTIRMPLFGNTAAKDLSDGAIGMRLFERRPIAVDREILRT